MEKAGVAAEAATALAMLLNAYEHGDEPTRDEVRQVFRAHTSFRQAVGLPREWQSPAEFRRRLILISARDQASDARDELVELWALCDRAREHGIDFEPIVHEVAHRHADASALCTAAIQVCPGEVPDLLEAQVGDLSLLFAAPSREARGVSR